ncbi:MAG: trigger factor [Acidimicrobiia bacterium]|nr:trigger factor [Acidimicrobiia bacterium]
MKTTVTPLEDNKVRLEVEVSETDLVPSLDQAARELSRNVDIHGFRKGKVPRPVLERHIGTDMLRQEAVRIALPRALAEAIEAEELDVIGRPEVEEIDDGTDGSLTFVATVDTRPQIEVGDLDAVEVRLDVSLTPTDDEVADQVDVLRRRFSTTEEVHRSARGGDRVVMNLETSIHGEKVETLSKNDIMYEVGAGTFVPKLDEKLEGTRAGEIVKFNDTLPASAGDQAGEEATFSVLVKEVRETVLPDVTDDWVAESSEFDTVADLREELARTMTVFKRQEARAQAQQKAIEAIVTATGLQVSDSLVDEEVEGRLHELEHDLEHRGASLGDWLRQTGETLDGLKAQMRDSSRRRIETTLVLQAVAEENELEVTDAELGEQVAILAAQSNRQPNRVLKDLRKSGRLAVIAAGIVRGKALAWVLDRVTILDADGEAVSFETEDDEVGVPEDGEPDAT